MRGTVGRGGEAEAARGRSKRETQIGPYLGSGRMYSPFFLSFPFA